jgi:site-specific recombinase XerD
MKQIKNLKTMRIKNEKTNNEGLLSPLLKRFLCEYIPCVRNLSANTLKSYRDTFRLLLPKAAKNAKKRVDELFIENITAECVKSFLQELESIRGCSISTRNQRLAAIHSFANYIAKKSPEHLEWCRNIHNIPIKKHAATLITYLEKEEMDAMLNAPDQNCSLGYRDYTLLLFLYNTGARADEVANLQIEALSLSSDNGNIPMVTIKGKGNKSRRCPLWKNTVESLSNLIKGRDKGENVFLNRSGNPLTRFGIYEMVTKYATQIEVNYPSIKAKRVSPHTIRHTTATHLLISGVDINTIRGWLGHVSINTTNIYAEVNLQMKAAALKCCEISSNKKRRAKEWKDDKSLMSFLDNL